LAGGCGALPTLIKRAQEDNPGPDPLEIGPGKDNPENPTEDGPAVSDIVAALQKLDLVYTGSKAVYEGHGMVDAILADSDGDGVMEAVHTYTYDVAENDYHTDVVVNELDGSEYATDSVDDGILDLASVYYTGGAIVYGVGQSDFYTFSENSAVSSPDFPAPPEEDAQQFINLVFADPYEGQKPYPVAIRYDPNNDQYKLVLYDLSAPKWTEKASVDALFMDQMIRADIDGDGRHEILGLPLDDDGTRMCIYEIEDDTLQQTYDLDFGQAINVWHIDALDINGDGIDELLSTLKDTEDNKFYLNVSQFSTASGGFEGTDFELPVPQGVLSKYDTNPPALLAYYTDGSLSQVGLALFWNDGNMEFYELR
jgi:hypothetical protein